MEGNKENKERYGIIYKIENTVNGKVYIGQTTRSFNERYHYGGKGIERVYKYHKSNKERNKLYNIYLLRSIEKYGFEAFTVDEEFDVAYSKEKLDDLERKYIKEFDCINNGYNNTEGGANGKRSEEACNKISEKVRERFKNPDERIKISKKVKEIWEDPEYRIKISEARKGKYCGENHPLYGSHRSEDERRKISESMKGKYCGENSPNYGRKFSEETRRKMSKKAEERFKDPEERRKISEALKGKRCGENNPMYGKGYKISGENNPMARKVVCLNDNKVFDTIKECTEYYKKDIKTIRRVCKHEQERTRDGLVFMYYDEYLQQQKQQDQAVI